MPATPHANTPLISPGSQVSVRDEEWIVRSVEHTPSDGFLVRCLGTSTLVRDTEATFLTDLDNVEPMRPEQTTLVADSSPRFLNSRLFLEAVIRKTPVPAIDTGLSVSQHQLLHPMEYQRRAAVKALEGLRPRLLIADAVGLGKTLEVGMILSELIRRGRGDRILVVTPRHILEQFQHELWTRFAIPLVRLDSDGIQSVRRKIPANRNPFTFYKRAIISIDTLKNAGRYRHHLEGIRWDAVVIDECHNLVNRGTLNNQLARVLAPRTEALILTSATPHNGDPASFAELIALLDPTAIVDPEHISEADIEHLYVRRHKAHDEVAAEVGSDWADRAEPQAIYIEASSAENALFAEIAESWTHPTQGGGSASGKGRSLFPWTLFKAALSSHRALAQTIAARRANLREAIANSAAPESPSTPASGTPLAEDAALDRLDKLNAAIDDESSSKLGRLVTELKSIGVSKSSPTRVVVFSERVATLDWLAEVLPARLGLNRDRHVRVLHGGMTDTRQMDVIEEFGLASSNVKLLLTGDMASEGVNLHRQCHHLIHYDLPWSLITIEQRNGRIDRYGQRHSPEIRALALVPDHPLLTGDARVLTRLLEREHNAHRAFGDSGSLLGLYDAKREEEAVITALRDGRRLDQAIPDRPAAGFDALAVMMGATGRGPAPLSPKPSLFEDERDFVANAIAAVNANAGAPLDLRDDPADPGFIDVSPPPDLQRRFDALPSTYLREQKVLERLRVTTTADEAAGQLDAARDRSDSQWPRVGYLSPLHPFVQWLTDKALTAVGRNEAPVLIADVSAPIVCVQGIYSNGRGQPQLVEWMAIAPSPVSDDMVVGDLFERLDAAGVGPNMANPGGEIDLEHLQRLIPPAVAAARRQLDQKKAENDRHLDAVLAAPTDRLDAWVKGSHQLAMRFDERRRVERDRHTSAVRDDTSELIESMRTKGQPLIRVLAVLAPADALRGGGSR
jgi:ERCC4-related helicase